MTNRPSFTVGRIASLVCPEDRQQAIFWDGKTPGLGIRITSKGARSFIFESRLHGKTLRITIGDVRTWRIADAQVEATRLKAITDQGLDPREQRLDLAKKSAANKAALKRAEVTLRDAWLEYVADRASRWSTLNLRDHMDVASEGGAPKKRGKGVTAPGPLAPLLDLRLSDVTASVVADWLERESRQRPTRARLAFNLLRIFYNWCESRSSYRGLIEQGAFATRIARDTLPKKQPKNDYLQREQLRPWFEAAMRIHSPVMSAYLQGLLLTGARREELAALKWSDVDFKWRSLTIKDKVEGSRVIPLTPYLADLLLELSRINQTRPSVRQIRRFEERGTQWQPSQWVFFSPTAKDGRIVAPNAALHRVCKEAGVPPITLHGLRRSFASLAEWTETPTGVVAQIMGHKPSATAERHYKFRPLDLLRSWHDKIETWILDQAGIKFPPKVQAKLSLLPIDAA